MSLASRSVARPVAVAMALLALALVGVVSAFRLPIDLLPDIAFPRLVVYTPWSGVAPAEMQRLVSEPIERAVARAPGIESVESVSREGVSLVTARFAWRADMDFAALAVREQLDNVRDALPEHADRPAVLRTDPTAEPVMSLAVTGRDLAALRQLAEAVLERRLEQIDGIAQVAVSGGPEREIQVDVDARALEAHGLGVEDVAAALDAANVSAPGGTIRQGRHRYPLRTAGELERIADMRVIPIDVPGSMPGVIRIGDVATVTDGWRERTGLTRHNGVEAIGLLLYKESGANTLRVSEQVEQVLAELRREYPDVGIHVAASQAGFIADSIADVVSALVVGGVLAFLVLFLFLGDPRYPLAVALSIPISVLVTFAFMDLLDVTLNVMSLGGLALGVGMLVDNSIVVLDNIARVREEEGAAPAAAAVIGTEQVQNAVVAVTLTTIAVFAPIVYIDGVAGALLRDVAITVSVSLLVSMVVALTVLPTLAARWMARPRESPTLARFRLAFERFAAAHQRALDWALTHPAAVLGATAASLLVAGAIAAALPRAVMPDVDQGAFRVRLEYPIGTPLERTAAAAGRVEAALLADSAVASVLSRVGRRENVGVIEERPSGSGTATLDVRLESAQSTLATLERVGSQLRRAAGGASLAIESADATPLAGFIADDAEAAVERAQPEVRVSVDRDAVARFGLDVNAVTAAVEAWTQGVLATHFVDFERRVPVWVRLPERERRSLGTLALQRIGGVPLRELVEVETRAGPAELRRAERADPAEDRRRSFASVGAACAIALALVYMIIAAQFESFVHPLIVMATVPLAAIGAVGALAITGAGLNAMSLIGIVILIGIVVDNAIVEIDFINHLRATGAPLRAAILDAGRARLRPILMTSVTTILGTLPLALGIGSGAELRAPMAIAVVGGLTSSTLLTLLVVPVLYERIDTIRGRR